MLSVAEAFARVLATIRPLPTETVPLAQSAGRILVENLHADRDFPPFDRVAMDGIALRHAAWAAGQTEFALEGAQYAGAPAVPLQNSQAAIEAMTGAVLPPGTDVVVRYEDLAISNGRARIRIPPLAPGTNIHPRAADRRQGDLLLPAGTRLGPAEVAVAATVGAARVRVQRRPRVALVSTGDELVPVDATPLPHQIRRSNTYALAALFALDGADCTTFYFPDDLPGLRQGLPALLGGAFDAVVFSGAVSQGKADFLPGVLRELGVREIFHGVAQRPGKPLWFGEVAGGPVVFGLPGNPVSTLVTAARYVRPWLQSSEQPSRSMPPSVAALAEAVSFRPALTHFLLVRLRADAQARLCAEPRPAGGSGDLAGLLDADGFVELPADMTDFPKGSIWPLWLFK
ncbi:molybdopterin molybdotransferase MoeA [Hymenobacter sp. ASUV-10]|uniref:Molybdopterin molybdenumtransferase n=1 Tax=Hymenobacter aranciens TaxID=3063996 RepID=A0ABT9BAL6_9BACT|nr:molybdopterin molybdotransferase MoeA [Hymenobacter sp. ASUV-10]MDO7874825.1 molybdopterin molybdotransferase MoeA [Hymenobacter sp. ASUV-10]